MHDINLDNPPLNRWCVSFLGKLVKQFGEQTPAGFQCIHSLFQHPLSCAPLSMNSPSSRLLNSTFERGVYRPVP
eukprot:scaffold3791_cov390-Prasinococcus_capsulatus_cf.AAC.6